MQSIHRNSTEQNNVDTCRNAQSILRLHLWNPWRRWGHHATGHSLRKALRRWRKAALRIVDRHIGRRRWHSHLHTRMWHASHHGHALWDDSLLRCKAGWWWWLCCQSACELALIRTLISWHRRTSSKRHRCWRGTRGDR